MPSGTSRSCAISLRLAAVVRVGDLAADAAAARRVRHQHRIAAGEREIGGERRALGAALFLDDLHQHDLPALDDLLDLVLAAQPRHALRHFLHRVGAADRFDHFVLALGAVAVDLGDVVAGCCRRAASAAAASLSWSFMTFSRSAVLGRLAAVAGVQGRSVVSGRDRLRGAARCESRELDRRLGGDRRCVLGGDCVLRHRLRRVLVRRPAAIDASSVMPAGGAMCSAPAAMAAIVVGGSRPARS